MVINVSTLGSSILFDLMFSLMLRSISRWRYQGQACTVLAQVRVLLEHSQQHSPFDFETLIDALVYAEDHRFYSHRGVDTRAIARAIVATTFTGRMQGGSTITQQLTRVITGDFRRSITRKFKELCIAAWLDAQLTKQEQAIAYLHMAYFGWRMNGLRQAAKRLHISLPCSATDAAAIVARLKYPEPREPTPRQMLRIHNRQEHIIRLMGVKSENSSRASNAI